MPRLFVSYSRSDEVFARRLATSLSEMGGDIWIDIRDIPAGMKWSSAIQQGLDICDAMIVILTPASMASSNVEDEWQYYRDRGKPIVPVMVQPTQLHYQLSRMQYINFYAQPYDIALTQLHAELWRKGIVLNQPVNAVTQPVPRMPAGAYSTPHYPAKTPPPAKARKSGSRGLLTLGCIGLVVAGIVLGGGALLLSNTELFGTGGDATRTPRPTSQPTTETPLPVPAATATTVLLTPTPTETPIAEVMSSSARLRMGPGVDYPEVAQFALRGEIYPVLASARLPEATEDWYLIDHPVAGRVWISSVVVDLRPDGFALPTAATVPPTSTPISTATPNVTATPLTRNIVFPCRIQFANQVCALTFNTDQYSHMNVRVEGYADVSFAIAIRDSANNLILEGNDELDLLVSLSQTYEVRVDDEGGGTGNITIYVTLTQ